MVLHTPSIQSRRRTGRRYVALVLLVLALIGGWSWFWNLRRRPGADASSTAGGRARHSRAAIYDCGTQSLGGYPFRIEVDCDRASARVPQRNQPPLEVKLGAHSGRGADLSTRRC